MTTDLTPAKKAELIEKRSAKLIEWKLQMNIDHKERAIADGRVDWQQVADENAAKLQQQIAAGFKGCPHCLRTLIDPKYGSPCFEATAGAQCSAYLRQRAKWPVKMTPEILARLERKRWHAELLENELILMRQEWEAGSAARMQRWRADRAETIRRFGPNPNDNPEYIAETLKRWQS